MYVYLWIYRGGSGHYKVAVGPPRRRQRRNGTGEGGGDAIYAPEVQSFAVPPPAAGARTAEARVTGRAHAATAIRINLMNDSRAPAARSAAQTFPSSHPPTTRRRFDGKFGEMRPPGPAVVSPYF